MALAILVELNIWLTLLVVETARLERRGFNGMAQSVRNASYKAKPKFKGWLTQAGSGQNSKPNKRPRNTCF